MSRYLTTLSKFPKDLEDDIARRTYEFVTGKELPDSPSDCTNANCRCKSRKKENEGLNRESIRLP